MQPTGIALSEFVPGRQGYFPGFVTGHTLQQHVPLRSNTFRFQNDLLRDTLGFLSSGDGDGLFLHGPTGCGKTSTLLEIAARLNWPVRRVNGHSRLELMDLVGSMGLRATAGGGTVTKFNHGPLAKAMAEGSIFVFDELDRCDPGIAAGIFPVLEGNPLVITENGGEVVQRHPNFRFVATGNTAGLGDDTGLHAGAQAQDTAYLDRFWVVSCDYLPEEVEAEILGEMFADDLAPQIRLNMVRVANLTRAQYSGTGKPGANLSVTFSTRTLIRWCRMLVQFSRAAIAGSKLQYCLDRALLMRAKPHEREAILQIAKSVFGTAWEPKAA